MRFRQSVRRAIADRQGVGVGIDFKGLFVDVGAWEWLSEITIIGSVNSPKVISKANRFHFTPHLLPLPISRLVRSDVGMKAKAQNMAGFTYSNRVKIIELAIEPRIACYANALRRYRHGS